MKWSTVSLAVAVALLLLADVLAFHDLFEPHTMRHWMMLLASVFAVVSLVFGSVGILKVAARRG